MFDKPYTFYGKHARMVKKLTGKLDDNIGRGIFDTNYDVYAIAPIVGYVYNNKAEIDKTILENSDSADNTKVFYDKIDKERDTLTFNYRMLMMAALKKKKTLEERIEIAFKLDEKDEERKEYDDLYNMYVRGGVEVIYNAIFSDAEDVDDIIKNTYNFFEDYNNRCYVENLIVELQ